MFQLNSLSNKRHIFQTENKLFRRYLLDKINFKKIEGNNEIYYIDSFGRKNRCYRSLDRGKPYCKPF